MKRLFFCICCLLLLLYPLGKIQAAENITERSAFLKQEKQKIADDERIVLLKKYLEKYNSPLSAHAQFIVHVADAYRIPWFLVPAISGVESTFCRYIPFNSFNCWGWNNGATRFSDYEDAIYSVTKGLKYGYFDKNLTDPYTIGPVYAPPSKTWAGKVVHFSNQIKSFTFISPVPDFSL